ncbi:hypothetical protein [Pseudoflavonifractor phocaeensis]|uniref:hypothetical protein n=1 Tax=Pseudoflavonifractor phocaeensis TaxID=1870988 RepID=UPI001959BD73|nr:hypothetical protein [Pseudoflavonifractor phocaeensis]MBM6724260.1 hypothetical protein [Pseudoflavonifractor phocaeensis]
MTKQELMEDYMDFMAISMEGKKLEQGEETCIMLDTYLYGMVLTFLQPDWFNCEKHEDAYKTMLNQFSDYRQKAGRFEEYVMIARLSKLIPGPEDRHIYDEVDGELAVMTHILANPADLGLIASNDAKDRKFCRKTIIQYIRRGFNRPSVAPKVLKPKPKLDAAKIAEDLPFALPPLNREARRALEKGQLPFPIHDLLTQPKSYNLKPPEPPEKDEQAEVLEMKSKFIDELHRYVIMLAGRIGGYSLIEKEADWDYLDLDTVTKVLNLDSRYAREAACLRPTSDACALCRPEFRRLLATIYYVRENNLPVEPLFKSGGAERESYFRAADALVLPLLDVVDEQIDMWIAVAGSAIEESHSCQDQLAEANQQIQNLQSKLDEASKQPVISPEEEQELARLREETGKAQQAAKAQEEALERLKEEATALKQEKARLLKALSESQSQYNVMNTQLWDLLEDKIDFVDDEIPDTPEAPAGIRAKIGEDVYQLLSNTRLAVVGGHGNTTTSLRDLFPDWKFFPTNTMVPSGLTSVDAMAVITSYVSHKTFEQAKSVATSAGVRVIQVLHNGPVSICRCLADRLGYKEEIAS